MKIMVRRLTLGLLWIGVASALGEPVREMRIFKGRSDLAEIDGTITRVLVMDERIVNAQPQEDGKSVLIMGVEAGKGQVRVQRKDKEDVVFNVTVLLETTQLAEELKDLLGNIDGLQIRAVGNRVALTGTLCIYEDFQRVSQVASTFKEGVLNLTRFDASKFKEILGKAIERDIGLDTVKVTITGDRGERARLEGYVFDERQVQRALSIAKTRVEEVDNLLHVEEIMIETDVLFLQIDKTKGKDIGFNILKTLGIEAGFEVSGGRDQASQFSYNVAGEMNAKINALIKNGDAKVVARPHMSTKSGGEGKFLSGGELGFKVSGNVGGSLEKVEYGVKLTVQPTLRGQNQIDTKLMVEVSVPTSAGEAGYSLDKFETTSLVKCNIGESIVVSGINQTLESRFQEHTPLLGKIPLLRMFFAEQQDSHVERELVVVLTPQPVFPSKAKGEAWSNAKKDLQ